MNTLDGQSTTADQSLQSTALTPLRSAKAAPELERWAS